VAEVLRKGNLGLGTLNGLDGEVRPQTGFERS
jgi:alpha-acetolactate decarboxylase